MNIFLYHVHDLAAPPIRLLCTLSPDTSSPIFGRETTGPCGVTGSRL
jgi:hypothetical protein